jgi:uncharacterized membrane protein YphA (DoxX/SURF4 family)
MENLFLIGRVIFGIYLLMNAYNHLAHSSQMAGYAASKKVPFPKAAILGSGLLLLIGGLSVLTGVQVKAGIAAIVLFLIPVTFTMHNYWMQADPMAKMGERVNFMKNMALLGAALMMLAIPTPWPFSL